MTSWLFGSHPGLWSTAVRLGCLDSAVYGGHKFAVLADEEGSFAKMAVVRKWRVEAVFVFFQHRCVVSLKPFIQLLHTDTWHTGTWHTTHRRMTYRRITHTDIWHADTCYKCWYSDNSRLIVSEGCDISVHVRTRRRKKEVDISLQVESLAVSAILTLTVLMSPWPGLRWCKPNFDCFDINPIFIAFV